MGKEAAWYLFFFFFKGETKIFLSWVFTKNSNSNAI